MSITSKVAEGSSEQNKYAEKISELTSTKLMFEKMAKRISEDTKKNKKSESKKKRHSDVYVTGATNKAEIRRLSRLLRQKISEVLSGDDDQKMKEIRVNDLQSKIASLDRILSQIERIEREETEEKRSNKKKKGKTEAVYLKSDDLTVNKRGGTGIDVTVSGGFNLEAMSVTPEPAVDMANLNITL